MKGLLGCKSVEIGIGTWLELRKPLDWQIGIYFHPFAKMITARQRILNMSNNTKTVLVTPTSGPPFLSA